MVSLKSFIEKGGKSYLTDKYKDVILSERTSLNEMLNGWNNENNLPEEYADILKRSMSVE